MAKKSVVARVSDDVKSALESERHRRGCRSISQTLGQLLAEQQREGMELPAKNSIVSYFHCRRCLEQRPEDQSPAQWARLSVGFTQQGLQVWCARHGINVAHIHFLGAQHPCNRDAIKPDPHNIFVPKGE
jgi:hypothetical protein